MQSGTCLLLHDVAAMWCIPPPSSRSSFEVSANFWDSNFDDICCNGTYLWYCL